MIATVLIAGLQVRPQGVFPSQGILQIGITDSAPSVSLVSPGLQAKCRGECNATSVNLTVTSIEVHTSGIDNVTGEWTPVCPKILKSLDLIQLRNLTQIICSTNIQPETITNIRLSVATITANISGVGIVTLTVPGGKLEIPISPLASVQGGKTATILVDIQPHIVCQGNGDCKITPVLRATSKGSM